VSSLDAAALEAGFISAGVPSPLAREVLESFAEAKRRYYLDDFMPNAVHGGRFTEAVLRVLEWRTTGTHTPLADSRFSVEATIKALGNIAVGAEPESVRLHIPRAARVIYDIRNKRNNAHLSDGIDPNVQDATLVVAVMSWMLAELVRLYHAVSAREAQEAIEALVSREVPMIQVFDGFPRVLRSLTASDHVLVLAYWAGSEGIDRKTLTSWLPKNMRANALRTIGQLHDKHLVHLSEPLVRVTRVGQKAVEARGLIQPL
jgi:hypothetical protein